MPGIRESVARKRISERKKKIEVALQNKKRKKKIWKTRKINPPKKSEDSNIVRKERRAFYSVTRILIVSAYA